MVSTSPWGAILTVLTNVAMALIATAILTGGVALWRRLTNRIKITSPHHGASLRQSANSKSSAARQYFRIEGTLKKLPKEHKIWVIVKGETDGQFWPQEPNLTTHDPTSGIWRSEFMAGSGNVTIYSVVAPPTSQMLFNYYLKHVELTDWSAIPKIPEECKNWAQVQVNIQ